MSKQLVDKDMVDIMTVLHYNYPLLWDLLNKRRKGEFSSDAQYKQLRNEIFTKLRHHVAPNIKNFWSDDFQEQEELMVDIISSAQPDDWHHGPDEFTVHCHHHYALLNDWGLKYDFSSTGHDSEQFGVPKDFIEFLDQVASAQKIVNTELKNFHLTQQFAEMRNPRLAIQSLAQFPTLTAGLFFSPTAQAMSSPQRPQSGSYHNSTHNSHLRRPLLLSRRFEGDSDEDRQIRKYLYLARQALRSGHPNTFSTVMSRAIRLNTCSVREQWLSAYADLVNVLGFLKENEDELKTDIDGDFGCQFCNRIGSANVLMLKERLAPASEEDQSLNKMMFRSMFHHYHAHAEIEPPATQLSSRLSFENQIRHIAHMIDVIVNPGRHNLENGGRRPPQAVPVEGRTALGDITNSANNNNNIAGRPTLQPLHA